MQPDRRSSQSPRPYREGSPKIGSIKRSSWNAGMAADFAQMAPPGSPAAWHEHRKSYNRDRLGTGGAREDAAAKFPRIADESRRDVHTPLRSRSPVKRCQQTPGLESIRSVSGSATMPGIQIDDTPIKSALRSSTNSSSTNSSTDGSSATDSHPFKFTSTYITPNAARPSRTSASKRRGHHYKHSSVSSNFFQEPKERAPSAIPVSSAVPTLAEYWQSVTKPQAANLAWCGAKSCVASGCYWMDGPVHSMASSSHMLAYETVVSTTIALVAILANFEVWSKSSSRSPFASKRVEVLVAFGSSVVSLFIGGDVISHIIQDLATGGDAHHHSDHAPHDGFVSVQGVGMSHYVLVSLAIGMTSPTAWREGTSNVLASSTVSFASLVLVIPSFPHQSSSVVDTVSQPAIVATMSYVGYTSSKSFGGMSAMSYGGPDRSKTISALVMSDPCVVQVEEISSWQVHYDLWLATMRITMSGTVDDERRVRSQASRAVREAVDVQDVDWETTIEIHRAETDYF